ncbi:MAG: hypothetical protein JW891_07350 [Candidatus Lokiarchaeota archaeon]|nr:hypothetical protein [Candidatus Lokiarchaeota archaeon]
MFTYDEKTLSNKDFNNSSFNLNLNNASDNIEALNVQVRTLEFNLPTKDLEITKVIASTGEICNRLSLQEGASLSQAGAPQLPLKTMKILLPNGFEYENIELELTNIKEISLDYKIEPAEEPVPIGFNVDPEITFNSSIYNSTDIFPGKYYSIEGIYGFRGYKVLILNLYPIQYTPYNGKVTLVEDMKIDLNLRKTTNFNNPLYRNLKKDENKVITFVENPEDVISYSGGSSIITGASFLTNPSLTTSSVLGLPPASYDYVIITNNALKNSAGTYTFQDLADFKNAYGIKTTIVTVEDIYASYAGRDEQEQIRNFIIDAYNNWGIEYVLLGGDGDGADVGGESGDAIVPARGFYYSGSTSDDNMPSDLYYAALDGTWNTDNDTYWGEIGEDDLYGEVYVGRAPVDTEDELSNFIMKTLAHETSTDAYLSNACMLGEDLGWSVWGGEYKDEVKDGSSNHNFTTVGFPSDYNVSTLYDMDMSPDWDYTDLTQIINNGVHVINHLGHANNANVMKMHYSDIDTILSNDKYFFAYSQGCYAGAFDNRDSYGSYNSYDSVVEHFVTSPYGAFAFIANSRYGWGNRYTTNGASQHFDREFFDAIFGEGITEIGRANQDSKEDSIPFLSQAYIRWCYYEINLFGDPTANILPQPNDNSPILTSESLTPVSGYQDTPFIFRVTYTDMDNNGPSFVRVSINGTRYDMEKQDPSDNDFTDGCVYQLNTYLQSAFYNYSYYFECKDSKFYTSTGEYDSLQVSYSNNNDPIMTGASVDPLQGYIDSTTFTFSINYSDIDNNAPQSINVMIDSISHSMVKLDVKDDIYIDGCVYVYSTKLNKVGTHSFSFECSDGNNIVHDGPHSGPLVDVGPSIAILNSNQYPRYFTGALNNDYSTIYNGLVSSGLDVTIITNDEIISGGLSGKDVVILIDNTPNDQASILLKDWCLNGGNLITFDSSICFLNWAGLLPPEANDTHGYGTYWDYYSPSSGVVVDETHPVLDGYAYNDIIYGTSGDSRYYSSSLASSSIGDYYYPLVKQALGSDYDLIVALDAPHAGKVVHVWDQYHWGRSSNQRLILNAIDWVSTPNIYSPELNNASVLPVCGYQNTMFEFSVSYADLDNNAPSYVNIVINGTSHSMTKTDPFDINYIDGCEFQFKTFLLPSKYNYSYYFECYDKRYSNSTSVYNNIKVSETNFFAPRLLNPQVTPNYGGNNTKFRFTVDYYDEDNNQADYVKLYIDCEYLLMAKLNESDINAMDGIQYFYETTLDFGKYCHKFKCSDGKYCNYTNCLVGPEVNPFYLYANERILFEDDFEDGYLTPDWTLEGTGGVGTHTSNSGIYSAYLCEGKGNIKSKEFDLSTYRNISLSFWLRRGDITFSEDPDIGEDLIVSYYDKTGIWIELMRFPGDGTPGEIIFVNNLTLPESALHSHFRFKFEQISGSGSGFDYWHFDDVKLNAFQYIELLTPSNQSTIYTGTNIFKWTSLNAKFGNIKYTLQISDTYNFSNIICQHNCIYETPDTTNISKSLCLSNGRYYWRVRPVFDIFQGNWSKIGSFNYMINKYAPVLSNYYVTPKIGDQFTEFVFFVNYYDKDDNLPIYMNVVINGTTYAMHHFDGLCDGGDDVEKVLYQFNILLDPSEFNYSYYFESFDGRFYTSTPIFKDVFIQESNYHAPKLLNPQVSPEIGIDDTIFRFTVNYFDDDNNLPYFVNITFVNGDIISMTRVDEFDNIALDGIQFFYETTLDFGLYEFEITCYDGLFLSSTGLITGPEVNPFLNYHMGIIFEDDFEDGYLTPDWTLGGTGGVNSYTSNSGRYSAYLCAGQGDITLRTIDLSTYQEISVSFWIRRGSDEFSEDTDYGEDFIVEYCDIYGHWIELAYYIGGGTPGEIFVVNDLILPTDALHSNFRLRFRQTSGSGAGYDYWHFDDVILKNSRCLQLILPENDSTIFNGLNTFKWMSLNPVFGPLNYTIQISDNSGFTTILQEFTGIVETPGMTTISLDLIMPNGMYYWRVLPVFNEFAGIWSEINTFNYVINDHAPILVNCYISPKIGNQYSEFTFSAVYMDEDNNAPTEIVVYINGEIHEMQKNDHFDTDYTDGCLYQFSTLLVPSSMNYSYYFEFSDGRDIIVTPIYDDLQVINDPDGPSDDPEDPINDDDSEKPQNTSPLNIDPSITVIIGSVITVSIIGTVGASLGVLKLKKRAPLFTKRNGLHSKKFGFLSKAKQDKLE